MTLYRTVAIGCDWLDPEANRICDAEYEGYPGESAAVVRRRTREAGWRRVDGNDYCPHHGEHHHDARVIFEDGEVTQFRCGTCGAEWFEGNGVSS